MFKIYNKISKYEFFLLIFVLIDVLFLPYFPIIATTFSQLLVFFWFIFKPKVFFKREELTIYYLIIFFITLSNLFSLMLLPIENENYGVENFKLGLALIMGISYYFFFNYFVKKAEVEVSNILFLFVIYVTLWGVVYFVDMNLFISIKKIFNPYDAFTGDVFLKLDIFNRYNFIWTDPNNIGYTIISVVSYLIVYKKTNNLTILISTLCMLFVLFLTMSGGSVLTALLVIPISFLYRFGSNNTLSKLLLIFTLIFSFFIISFFSARIINSEIGEKSIERLEEKTESEEPRIKIWARLIENKNILFYTLAGEGSTIFLNSKPYSPHNGHLMLIFSYGIVCWFLYFYIVFWKYKNQSWNNYIFIIPFFLCFTINIAIGELKYAALMYLMVTLSRNNLRFS